ncbi:MAG: hypothetical protein JNJ61_29160 [Anaerolineae bacterium]|nr:hypothetical protein [Anaerolineae bacterium]
MCRSVMLLLLALLAAGCNLRTNNATNTPFPTPNIPQVRFLFPENNSTVLEGTEIVIQLLAEDPGAGVTRVELLIDDVPYQEGRPEVSPVVPTFTVNMPWVARGVGLHSLTALAFRADGTASSPVLINVEVLPRPETTPG